VVDAISAHYLAHNANVARAMHVLGAEATDAFEAGRLNLARFIGAARPEEVVFTKNGSEALNLAAHTLGARLGPADEIVVSVMEHHSNIVPWQLLAERTGAVLRWFDITDDGGLDNRRTFAPVLADGICMDAEGAVWTPSWYENEPCCLRVADGGEVLDRIPLEHAGFACALGGADGRTLFMLTADWRMDEDFGDNLDRLTTGPPTGRVLTATVSVPSAGWPNRR